MAISDGGAASKINVHIVDAKEQPPPAKDFHDQPKHKTQQSTFRMQKSTLKGDGWYCFFKVSTFPPVPEYNKLPSCM